MERSLEHQANACHQSEHYLFDDVVYSKTVLSTTLLAGGPILVKEIRNALTMEIVYNRVYSKTDLNFRDLIKFNVKVVFGSWRLLW